MTKMKSAGILGVLAAIAIAGAPLVAGAQGHGGGGGGHSGGGGGGGHMGGGGGGGHMGGGGGGGHMGGGGGHFAGGAGARFSGVQPGGGHFVGGGGRFAGGNHFGGGHASVGARGFYGSHPQYSVGGGGHFYGTPGVHAEMGHGLGRPGFVHGNGRFWGGGYWGGRFWPGVRYGPGFAWYLPVLPFGYATYYWGGLPYYFYDNAYYTWDSGYDGYVATDPPPVGEAGASDDTSGTNVESDTTSAGTADLYVYPRNGQSEEQTSNDRFECHKWAVSQSGFDPTRSSNPQGASSDYRRAIGACLDARGYSAK
ncbi:MAG: hypothetical protein JWN85_3527 [Gammaproteobacteria bacterium]|nr:hypothetical protein [Gammaproteobacteria bacterium]